MQYANLNKAVTFSFFLIYIFKLGDNCFTILCKVVHKIAGFRCAAMWIDHNFTHKHTHSPLHLEPPFSGNQSYFTHTYTPLPLWAPLFPWNSHIFWNTEDSIIYFTEISIGRGIQYFISYLQKDLIASWIFFS